MQWYEIDKRRGLGGVLGDLDNQSSMEIQLG